MRRIGSAVIHLQGLNDIALAGLEIFSQQLGAGIDTLCRIIGIVDAKLSIISWHDLRQTLRALIGRSARIPATLRLHKTSEYARGKVVLLLRRRD